MPTHVQQSVSAALSLLSDRFVHTCMLSMRLVPSFTLLLLLVAPALLQLVAVACQVLCTLAPLYTPVSSNISQLLTKCYNIAQAAFMQQQGLTAVSPALTHNAPK